MSGVRVARAGVVLRDLRPSDAADVRALSASDVAESRYSASLRSALDPALAGVTAESRGMVALQAGRAVGVAVFGGIAGALGAGRIQLVVVERDLRRRGIASCLVDGALAELAAAGMRVAFVELPDDPLLSAVKQLLGRCGFRIDARVADYFRDGVDLAILRHDLG
jgi:ribosomal protein S18 acetylase RimI-like enzyme